MRRPRQPARHRTDDVRSTAAAPLLGDDGCRVVGPVRAGATECLAADDELAAVVDAFIAELAEHAASGTAGQIGFAQLDPHVLYRKSWRDNAL
jgi:hypothetical protein